MHLDHTSLQYRNVRTFSHYINILVMIHCSTGLKRRWLLECEAAVCFLQFWFSHGHFSRRSFTLTLPSSPSRLAWHARLLRDRNIAHVTLARHHTSSRSMSYSGLLERVHMSFEPKFILLPLFDHHYCRGKRMVLYSCMVGWVGSGRLEERCGSISCSFCKVKHYSRAYSWYDTKKHSAFPLYKFV